MSEQKTKPTGESVERFLDAVEPHVRRTDGIRLAEIFREVTGSEPVMWGPSIIGYGSFNYASPNNSHTRGVWPKTGFSPRKARHSLYGLKDSPEGAALLPKLGKFTEGAGCVYVTRLTDVDEAVLRELIAIAWNHAQDAW